MHARSLLGDAGEELAARHLARAGYRVLEHKYRSRAGEVDLVAVKGSTLVFCEVKTRGDDRFGMPAEAVGYAKQMRLRRSAAQWLAERKPGPVDVRFDVVSVIVRDGRPEVTHIPDAF